MENSELSKSLKERKQKEQSKEQKQEAKEAALVAAANETKSRVTEVSPEGGKRLRIEPVPGSRFFTKHSVYSFRSIQLISSPVLAGITVLYYFLIRLFIPNLIITWVSSALLAYATIAVFFLFFSRLAWRPFCIQIIDDEFVFLNYSQNKIIDSDSVSNVHYKVEKYPSNGWASLIISSSTYSKKIAWLSYTDTDSLVTFLRKADIRML
ncbi:MAG: hypothetical protein GY754_22225 [bacterium]|nr:hypothetical protein [bacterium]